MRLFHRLGQSLSAVLALALLPQVQGCSKGTLPICPGEHEGALTGGSLPEGAVRSVSDPTAGGALVGKPAGRDRPKKLILLLDYSGSMYGGYGKDRVAGCDRCDAGLQAGRPSRTLAGRPQPYYVGSPDFQDFLARWLDAATPPMSDLGLEILLFNGRVFHLGDTGVEPFVPGMELRFARPVSQASSADIAAWMRKIPGNPYDVDSTAANTTDSRAALRTAVAAVGDEALLWLVTDNIVDTEGGTSTDPDARLNTEFYRELDAEPRLQMIAAYPIFRAKPCTWMCGTSLFIYGMYVSRFERPESAEFHRLGGTTPQGGPPATGGLLWNSALQKLAAEYSGRPAVAGSGDLAGVPVRLKPIDTEALTIGFGRPPALRCARAEFGQELRCQARVEVSNALRHQTVESAQLRLSNEILLPRQEGGRRRLPWASAVCGGRLETLSWQVRGGHGGIGASPIEIGPLAPLEKAVVDVRFKLPPIVVAAYRRSTLFEVASTNRIVLDGLLRAEIRDFRTSLAIDPNRFALVYGSAQLPAIFRKGVVGSATATYRVDARLANDGQALALLALLGIGGGGTLALLVAMRFKSKQFTVFVDGAESARVSLRRWSRRELEVGGAARAYLWRGWGSSYRIVPCRGTLIRRDGAAWVLRVGDDIGEEHRIEIFRGWSPVRPRSPFSSRMDNW